MTKVRKGKTIVDWEHMNERILWAVENLGKKGFKEPTVRAVYYVLGSTGDIPLTHQGYKSLDAKVVKMRKDGEIPWGFFAVKRGTSVETEGYQDPKERAEGFVNYLKNAHKYYDIPRWFGQEKYVEVWVEKDGLLGALHDWTSDLGVTVRAPQGYGAWEFINDSLNKINSVLEDRNLAAYPTNEEQVEVHIKYLGDLDPSGKDIPRFINEGAFEHFGFTPVFEELALNPDQIGKYGLPEIPDSEEVIAKIRRDPRYRKYLDEYGEQFCELDAFFALATEEARALIRGSIENLFDPALEKRRKELEQESKDKVHDIIREHITFLDEEEG
jgi:hypothetical protein